MPEPLNTEDPILIIGAGTWGSSIAYQLAKRGHTVIKVLDAEVFPSAISAGNDVNKILEEVEDLPSPDQDDDTYTWATIHKIATDVWKKDPVYSPHYHSTGFIYAAVGDPAFAMVEEECRHKPHIYEPLRDVEALRKTMPEGVLDGDLQGWRGFIRRTSAGWVEAQDTMIDVYREASRLGVTFVCDAQKGNVLQLLYTDTGDAIGARTADGKEHQARTVILAVGVSSTLLLDFEDQLRPTAWTLAHVALTTAEVESGKYNELAVLYGADRGFFLPPPASAFESGKPEIKICDEHPGYINLVPDSRTGTPNLLPWHRSAIPSVSAKAMREFLHETAAHLAERPLLRPRLCWDSDTPDRHFLLSEHPRHQGLFVAAGGSGHGFMCSPAVGVLVADLVEDRMEERLKKRLSWRPETAVKRDWFATQGRFGRNATVRNLQDFNEDEWYSGD